MGRIIALTLVFAGIWWMWRRWVAQQTGASETTQKTTTQKLTPCQRCDAMLPSDPNERREIARSCEHQDRCPLQQNN